MAAAIFNVTFPFFLPLIVRVPFFKSALRIFFDFFDSFANESFPCELTYTFKTVFFPFLTVSLLIFWPSFLMVIFAFLCLATAGTLVASDLGVAEGWAGLSGLLVGATVSAGLLVSDAGLLVGSLSESAVCVGAGETVVVWPGAGGVVVV